MLAEIIAGFLVALAAIWLMLVIALAWMRPSRDVLRDAASLPVDVLRLVRALLSDSGLPRGARVRLWLLFAYLATPVDLVPDFIPVIGYADDVVVVSVLLGGAIRVAGFDRVREHWSGSAAGLSALARLCRIGGEDREWS